MAAGRRNRRVSFHRLDSTTDDYGNVSTGFSATPFLTVWGELRDMRGAERDEGAGLSSIVRSELRVLYSADTAAVTEADQVRVGSRVYNIRSIDNPDEINRDLVMVLERGVA